MIQYHPAGTESVLPKAQKALHHGHMARFAEYCPVAVGVDVLGDRWTPLVIRELLVGASGFNEIHRGIPRISRTLLAQRLRQLERRGLVRSEHGDPGRPGRYTLTPAGKSLAPIVRAIGQWAAEWIFGDPTEEDSDGLSLMWRAHQLVIAAKLPRQRTVVHMTLTGAGAAEGWLDIQGGVVTVCMDDPGYDIDLTIQADTGQMQRWLIGLVPFRDLIANGHARVLGPSRLIRAFPTWFDTTRYAESLHRAELRRQAMLAQGLTA
jgi:DNA-binding HxlR family transcriptional regulator